ncbi:MAG TPA: sulfotransferase [Acetobacteraceae bacterium]|jgi:hypothetical protein
MALSVIGTGFGRTGTNSLKLALEQLGLGPCHHMHEVRRSPEQHAYWSALARGERVDWDTVFAGFGSACDWPSCHFWRELAAHYPAARVIHTTRPAEAWWGSFSQTIMPLLRDLHNTADPTAKARGAMAYAIIAEQTFGAAMDNKQAALAAYRRREEEVRAEIPAERLLVFDVAEGWEKLCRFLGLPAPAGPFPRTNSTADFIEATRGTA